jgi:hypothetical protein
LIEAEGPDGRPVSVAEGIPWEFYLYHTGVRSREQPATSGGEWVLIDLTTPLRLKQNRGDSSDFGAAMFQQGIVRPPRQLFKNLNTRLRFRRDGCTTGSRAMSRSNSRRPKRTPCRTGSRTSG